MSKSFNIWKDFDTQSQSFTVKLIFPLCLQNNTWILSKKINHRRWLLHFTCIFNVFNEYTKWETCQSKENSVIFLVGQNRPPPVLTSHRYIASAMPARTYRPSGDAQRHVTIPGHTIFCCSWSWKKAQTLFTAFRNAFTIHSICTSRPMTNVYDRSS